MLKEGLGTYTFASNERADINLTDTYEYRDDCFRIAAPESCCHLAKLSAKVCEASVGVNGTDTHDAAVDEMRDRIINTAVKYDSIKRLQSFIIDLEEDYISFYIVPDYSMRNREEEIRKFIKEIGEAFPETHMEIHKAIDL